MYTVYYHNTRIESTKIQALCTLKISFDISTVVVTQFNLYKDICSYKYSHTSGPKGSPDMIMSAFGVKFYEKKDEMPPKACNPSYTFIYLHIPTDTIIYHHIPSYTPPLKIIENQQIHKKSILQCWYTHSSISHAHGSNNKAKNQLCR